MATREPESPEPVDLDWPVDRPELLAFLPLIHAAWADGVLTEAELETLSLHIEGQLWLDQDDRHGLRAWLRPERPPTPSSLARTGATIRELGARVPDRDRISLADLGLGMARAAGAQDGPWSAPAAREELREMERDLGMAGTEAVRKLLAGPTPPPVSPTPPPRKAPFDVEGMRHYLDQPHEDLRRRIVNLLADPALRPSAELDRAAYREAVLDAVRRLAREGLGSLAYPEEFGGRGSPGLTVAAFESLAFGDLSVLVKFGVQFGLFGGSVLQLGTRRHHEAWLADIGSLALPGGFAMTEVGHGSNVRDLQTTA
ncbi:MAG TPA: acyl-CoA dehydrogenase family protein, partial [Longimicrobiales bacterium]|nr:acyl-CoA dehydrogenase family protein [Longimicrobiales bacterium]